MKPIHQNFPCQNFALYSILLLYGTMDITYYLLVLQISNQELATWEKLTIYSLVASLKPLQIHGQECVLTNSSSTMYSYLCMNIFCDYLYMILNSSLNTFHSRLAILSYYRTDWYISYLYCQIKIYIQL